MLHKKVEKMEEDKIKDALQAINELDKEYFLHYSKQMLQHLPALLKKFSSSITSYYTVPDITCEADACAFCLGIYMCKIIYPEAEISKGLYQHQPLISIVIHLSQFEIYFLLKYTVKWYETIGLTQSLARWMFVLLICLRKPMSIYVDEFLYSLALKLRNDKDSKTGAEFVRLSYLLKCVNAIYDAERRKNIAKLMQYLRLSIKMSH